MKTRTAHRSRYVVHTVDGKPEVVEEQYKVQVPVPPRDWDSIVRIGVTAIACVLVTVSLAWTTASIGDLLALTTIPAVAYAAGVAFDLSWVLCMGVEWLLRYEPDRAEVARRAGNLALLISMGAVFAHGYLAEQWPVGAAGAAVSLLAKGSWTISMRVHARELDPLTAQWVAKRRAQLDGQLAMIPVRRELLRGEQLVEAERQALAAESGSSDPFGSGPSGNPNQSADGPDPSGQPAPDRSLTTKDAVRIVWDEGIRTKEEAVRAVSARTGRPVSPDTVRRYLDKLRPPAS